MDGVSNTVTSSNDEQINLSFNVLYYKQKHTHDPSQE